MTVRWFRAIASQHQTFIKTNADLLSIEHRPANKYRYVKAMFLKKDWGLFN